MFMSKNKLLLNIKKIKEETQGQTIKLSSMSCVESVFSVKICLIIELNDFSNSCMFLSGRKHGCVFLYGWQQDY